MVTIKALDELTPADLWREVPEDRDFWREAQERQREVLKRLLEGALEAELVELLGASRYRRTEVRHGYRNGFYQRDLATQIGIVKGIRVPRARTSVGDREVFRRYQRRQAQVNALIRGMFLAGISTRRVGACAPPPPSRHPERPSRHSERGCLPASRREESRCVRPGACRLQTS